MSKPASVQRATKLERLAVREVLKGLWDTAYTEGEVLIDYPRTVDGERKAKYTHAALGDYRREMRKKQLDNFTIYTKIQACSLIRVDIYTIKLVRKAEKFSNRSNVILDLANKIPEIDLHDSKTNIDSILDDFRD